MPGHPDRRASAARRDREPRADRAGLPAFRHLRRLRDPALDVGALSRLEARSGRRRAGAGRPRCAGRRADRRPRRGPPPRHVPCAARHSATCSRSASPRCARTTSSAIDRCPVLAPSLDGAIAAAWAIAEALEPQKKPLDIQVTATDAGLDIDVRGSGPLPRRADGELGAHRRRAPARAAHPAWRADRAARDADRDDRPRARRLAARLVPAGDRGRRSRRLAALVRAHIGDGQGRRRSVLRRRAVRAAAGRALPRQRRSMTTPARSPRSSRRPARRRA